MLLLNWGWGDKMINIKRNGFNKYLLVDEENGKTTQINNRRYSMFKVTKNALIGVAINDDGKNSYDFYNRDGAMFYEFENTPDFHAGAMEIRADSKMFVQINGHSTMPNGDEVNKTIFVSYYGQNINELIADDFKTTSPISVVREDPDVNEVVFTNGKSEFTFNPRQNMIVDETEIATLDTNFFNDGSDGDEML